MKNAKLHFAISLVFPFPFEDNVTVQAPPGLPTRPFTFDSILLPSSIAFAAVTAFTLLLVIFLFFLQIYRHQTSTEQSYIKLVRNGVSTSFPFPSLSFPFLCFPLILHYWMTFKCLFSKEFFISLGVVFLLLASTGLWISSLVSLKKGVDNEIQFVFDTCDKYRECEKNLPNYVTLYLSTVSIRTNPLYKKFVSLKLVTSCLASAE